MRISDWISDVCSSDLFPRCRSPSSTSRRRRVASSCRRAPRTDRSRGLFRGRSAARVATRRCPAPTTAPHRNRPIPFHGRHPHSPSCPLSVCPLHSPPSSVRPPCSFLLLFFFFFFLSFFFFFSSFFFF